MTNGFVKMFNHVGRLRKAVESMPRSSKSTRQEVLKKVDAKLGNQWTHNGLLEKMLIKIENSKTLDSVEELFYTRSQMAHFPIYKWKELQTKAPKSNADTQFVDHVDISNLDLSTVKVKYPTSKKEIKIDFYHNAITYGGSKTKIKINEGGYNVPTCSGCELFNRIVLFSTKNTRENDKRSVILRLNGKVVGYIKLTGELSFLATRTVFSPEGKNIFIKGMVYGIDPNLHREVWKLGYSINDGPAEQTFRVADLEEILKRISNAHKTPHDTLHFRHQRFILDQEIFDALDAFTESFD
jgi:hypothetical protein